MKPLKMHLLTVLLGRQAREFLFVLGFVLIKDNYDLFSVIIRELSTARRICIYILFRTFVEGTLN